MNKSLIEITGFNELYKQIQKLDDRVKRAELLKIYGQLARPTVNAAKSFTPVGTRKHTRDDKTPGNLRRSIGKRIGKKGDENINAVLYVAPLITGKKVDGWYAHFITHGTQQGIKANNFMQRAYDATAGMVTDDFVDKTAKYIQKQIDRLSK